MSKTYADLNRAQHLAGEVIDLLRPAFVNLHVGGSIRRGKAQVSDIEIIGIPTSTALFQQRTEKLLHDGTIAKHNYQPYQPGASHRWGDHYRGFDYKGMLVEIFTAEPHTFGYIYWLRTGPGKANTAVMTWLKRYRSPVRMTDGTVWHVAYEGEDYRKLNPLRVPDEHTLFDLINVPFVVPEKRGAEYYTWYMDNSDWRPPPLSFIQSLYLPTEKRPAQMRLF